MTALAKPAGTLNLPDYDPLKPLPYVAVKDEPGGQVVAFYYLNTRTNSVRCIPCKVRPGITGDDNAAFMVTLKEMLRHMQRDIRPPLVCPTCGQEHNGGHACAFKQQ